MFDFDQRAVLLTPSILICKRLLLVWGMPIFWKLIGGIDEIIWGSQISVTFLYAYETFLRPLRNSFLCFNSSMAFGCLLSLGAQTLYVSANLSRTFLAPVLGHSQMMLSRWRLMRFSSILCLPCGEGDREGEALGLIFYFSFFFFNQSYSYF